MKSDTQTFDQVLRRPSAFLPIAMSLTALAIVLIDISIFGAARQPDEGAAAHLWQILMAGQVPVFLWFAIQGLRKAPRFAWRIVALQAGAALASCAPVYLLHL